MSVSILASGSHVHSCGEIYNRPMDPSWVIHKVWISRHLWHGALGRHKCSSSCLDPTWSVLQLKILVYFDKTLRKPGPK